MASSTIDIRDQESPDARFYAVTRIVVGMVALGATSRYAIKAATYEDTGFEPWHERDHRVPPQHAAIVDECMPHYEALYAQRLRA